MARTARVASFLLLPMFFWDRNSGEKLSIFCLVGVVYCFNSFLSTLTLSSKLGSQIETVNSSRNSGSLVAGRTHQTFLLVLVTALALLFFSF